LGELRGRGGVVRITVLRLDAAATPMLLCYVPGAEQGPLITFWDSQS
jgi:hypothetical protein